MTEHERRELDPPTTPLKRGDSGPKVRRVQEWLTLHGHGTAIDGEFGPATKAALKAFQMEKARAEHGEDAWASGTVAEWTWAALTEPMRRVVEWKPHSGAEVGHNIVDCAHSHLFAQPREVGKPNGGPFVRIYCRGQEVPWCAGFATTVLGQALGHDDWYTLSCDDLAAKAKERGRFKMAGGPASSLRPGDLFLIRAADGLNDWIHCGIVTAVGPDYFETVEGNTNTDGRRDGTEVCKRVRAFKPNVDFVLTGGNI